jgi:hypothetical protein
MIKIKHFYVKTVYFVIFTSWSGLTLNLTDTVGQVVSRCQPLIVRKHFQSGHHSRARMVIKWPSDICRERGIVPAY